VRASWGEHFDDYARDNVLATQRLLDAARGQDLRAWVYGSSASVYGNDVRGPVGEDELPAPHSPYGVTKLAAEHLAHLYRRNYGVPTLSLRLFSVYGPRERPDKAIQIFLEAARDGRGITVLGDGTQHRDFTFVSDAVDAIVAALDRAPVGETLNVARGRTLPLSAVIEAIRVVSGRSLAVRHASAAAGDVRVTAARIDRARRVLGYDPATDLEDGIRRQWAHVLMGPGTPPV
jgi:nucleoside-diphosphate-sugar epimerase